MSKKDKLIVSQLLKIKELEDSVKEFEEQRTTVYGLLYNIGAPLNDNKLQFNTDQQALLIRIANALDLR